jgi:hypothetical protein
MNYAKHYDAMMSLARDRKPLGYSERHHIIPKCMGGSNNKTNLVDLTGHEHFVAHQLLVKIHPHIGRLVFSLLRMSAQCNNGRTFSWIRQRCAEENKGNKHRLGMPQTPHMRAALRASHIGRKNTPETKAKMSLAAMGNQRAKGKKYPHSPEHRAAISAAKKGKKMPPRSSEYRLKLSVAIKASWQRRNAEVCKRIAQ